MHIITSLIIASALAVASAAAQAENGVHSKVVDNKQKPLSPCGRGVGERG
ncbi:MAG: hypothetical protein Q7J38_16660 [Gallionella sp.]|nr:hypothetical protein [Gallionella sp.]